MTMQDVIDLAIEYGLIASTTDFRDRNPKQQVAIIRQLYKGGLLSPDVDVRYNSQGFFIRGR